MIGKQGVAVSGAGAVAAATVGTAVVLTGADQAIRYGIENKINSMTNPNHV